VVGIRELIRGETMRKLPNCKQCGVQIWKGKLCYECYIRKYPYENYGCHDPGYSGDAPIEWDIEEWLVDLYMSTPLRYRHLE
jgi:hypothetical protein